MITKITQYLVCQGRVIHYDQKTQTGFIHGFDSNEYSFLIPEWQNEHEPKVGMIVNFRINEKEAIHVRLNQRQPFVTV